MKIIKIIILSTIILQSCFPSFSPKEEIKKELYFDGVSLMWVHVVGIMDQDFPDYISIQKGKQKDILCKSHNIADVNIKEGAIVIGFYGTPKKYSSFIQIPNKVLGYKIEIDTTFVKESK